MLTHLTDILTTLIKNLYSSTGLAGIVLAMAIESCCIPLPSEIVMPLAGVMLASGTILGGVNPWAGLLLVALAGAVGCLIEMPFVKFCVYTLLGSFPWCLLLAYAGYVLGNHLATLGPIFRSLDVVIIVAVILLVALYIWRHIRNDRKARASHAVAEAEARSVNQQMLQSEQPPTEQTQFRQPWPHPQQSSSDPRSTQV